MKKSFLFDLYEECKSTNLNFPQWEYKPFSLDNFDSSEARAEFRVDREDIPLLKMKLARYIRLNRHYLSLTSLRLFLAAVAEVVTLNKQINN